MSAPWTEEGAAEHGVTIRFRGVDAERATALEVEGAMRAVRYGVRPRPGPPHPGRAVALLALAALAVVPALLPGGERLDFGARWAAAVGGVLLFLILVFVLLALLSRPPKADVGADFALTLGREGFECRGGERATIRVALEDIERFEGAARLTVRRRDGTAIVLPATLARGDHAALAAHLSARLAEVRAAHAGYRGNRVRVAEDASAPDDDHTDDAAAPAPGARR